MVSAAIAVARPLSHRRWPDAPPPNLDKLIVSVKKPYYVAQWNAMEKRFTCRFLTDDGNAAIAAAGKIMTPAELKKFLEGEGGSVAGWGDDDSDASAESNARSVPSHMNKFSSNSRRRRQQVKVTRAERELRRHQVGVLESEHRLVWKSIEGTDYTQEEVLRRRMVHFLRWSKANEQANLAAPQLFLSTRWTTTEAWHLESSDDDSDDER